MPAHSTLTGADLHEPKGVAAATVGKVYVSDGLGSGSWTNPPYAVTGVIPDVSTVDQIYIPIPYAGTVVKVVTVLEGSLTTANGTVTVRNAANTSMGTLTITQVGSAAGDIDILNPVSNNTVTNDSRIRVDTDGACDTVRKLFVTVFIRGS
jgi:hypothetical protein